ncbi:MAG: rRNA pseudouridine synthase [candidate division NC10 bacterium]|nr:rRNA pseudouridine synthase [candidate division NC10 bacterium]
MSRTPRTTPPLRPDGGRSVRRPAGQASAPARVQPPPAPAGGERLQKVLARTGIASRREAETLIAAGRVRVNGQIVRVLGARVVPGRDEISVDGERIRGERVVTLMVHKPAGFISSRSDPEGRPVVGSLLPPKGLPNLYPVGRLDWESEGLLLLSNDGELANLLTHPRHGVRKVYRVKLKGRPTDESLRQLVAGVVCQGERLRAVLVERLRSLEHNCWVTITLEAGRHHHIRRMCEAVGHPVLRLIRVAFGPLSLGSLARGRWRLLTREEEAALAWLRARAGEKGLEHHRRPG